VSDRPKKCLLVQNGRSTRGTADRFCGFTDPPLSAEGRQAVLSLRTKLLNEGESLPSTWYVSDRRRAVETFEILTAGRRAPVVRLTEGLREINFGDYENLTWDELPEDFRQNYQRKMSDPIGLAFPNGESFYELCERVSLAAIEILSLEDDEANIGIVGHQGSLRVWALMVQNESPARFFDATMEAAECRWVDLSLRDVTRWRREYLAKKPG
jgi:broad specificity phosphatase PhoE